MTPTVAGPRFQVGSNDPAAGDSSFLPNTWDRGVAGPGGALFHLCGTSVEFLLGLGFGEKLGNRMDLGEERERLQSLDNMPQK
ncbi:MAG: hypothetical protein ACI841_004777 [Planctomycetota bacterium]|jgi:hypothetical protein